MNWSFPSVAEILKRLSPRAAVILGILYTVGVASIEVIAPNAVRVSLLYVFGVALVAFRAGRNAAVALALLASTAFAFTDSAGRESGIVWTLLIRFLVLVAVGWLLAEAVSRAAKMAALAQERSQLWKAEAEKHQATAERLSDALDTLKQVTSNINEVLWLTDLPKQKSVFVSPGYERTWGRKCAELYDNPMAWVDSIHPNDRERVREQALTQQQSGRYDTQYRIIKPDGTVRWVHDRAFPVRNQKGETYRVVGLAQDITERKHSEFLLEAQRDLAMSLSLTSDLKTALRRLLEVAVQMEGLDCGAVYLLDADTGEIDMTAYVGLTDDFVKAVSHFSANAPQTRLVMAGKPVYALHEAIRTTPDQEHLLALAVLPLRHEGKVLGAINLGSHTQREIPEATRSAIEAIAAQASGAVARLRAEEALFRSEARLRAIITGAPLIVFAGDQDGRVIFQEGQALKAIGSAPGRDVGRNITDVFERMPAILEDIRRVLSGEEFSSVIQVRSQFFDCWFSPTRDREGNVQGFIGVATNVTERQRLQRQILEISDREQARMGQDLHDGLCQQLVSLAFDANSLETRLTAANHPEAATARRIADFLDEAITQSRQLARGLFPIRLEAEGLTSALEELARSTQERFGVHCLFKSTHPVLVADNIVATHVYRIAQEAVTNAIKHARPKRVTIAVQASSQSLTLRIDDDGVGLPPEDQRQPAGMGLHIMRYRAQSIGGALRLARNSQGGTTVSCQVAQPSPLEPGS